MVQLESKCLLVDLDLENTVHLEANKLLLDLDPQRTVILAVKYHHQINYLVAAVHPLSAKVLQASLQETKARLEGPLQTYMIPLQSHRPVAGPLLGSSVRVIFHQEPATSHLVLATLSGNPPSKSEAVIIQNTLAPVRNFPHQVKKDR